MMSKKNVFRFSLLMIILLAFLTGCSSSEPTKTATTTTPPQTPTATNQLEFATDEYPPFEFAENGQIKGISTEIVNEAFKRMGIKIVIKTYPWARAMDMVKNGEVDGIFSVFKTPERKAFIDFPTPLVADVQSLFVLKDSDLKFDGDLSKLNQESIASVTGYSYGEKFDTAVKNGVIKLESTADITSNFEKLLSKRVNIYVESKYSGIYILKKMGKLDQVKALSPDVNSPYGYLGFSKSKKHTELIAKFNTVLEQMKNDGTTQKIIDSYIK